MKTTLSILFIFINLLVANSQNVMITDQGNPNEPTIMFDYHHPDTIMAACNINNYFVSMDGGLTWSINTLSSSLGVWGDPVLDIDIFGDFYFFHLSNPPGGNWIDRIVCQKTTDHGATWTDGSYAGLDGTKAQDKHWTSIDRSNNTIHMTWTQFDVYGSENPADSSAIMYAKSTDAGLSWTPAIRINQVGGDCIDGDNTTEGAVPAVGPNGEVYVAWAGPLGITFDKSTDGGNTWLENDIHVDDMPTGWNYVIPGISRANGLPITKCDTTQGEFHGTIYVNWSDQRHGDHDTDVWFAKSVDQGITWSDPIRVNGDAPGKHQFFTWMDIDQTNGDLYFIYYDRRNFDDLNTEVYVAKSTDGGNTFTEFKISESPFVPHSGIFFGDYNNIVAHDGLVRPIWTRLHEGNLSLWTHIGTYNEENTSVISNPTEQGASLVKEYPNPTTDQCYISYKLHEASQVSIHLYDSLGKEVRVLMPEQTKEFGKHVESFSLKGLSAGNYIYKVMVNQVVMKSDSILIE